MNFNPKGVGLPLPKNKKTKQNKKSSSLYEKNLYFETLKRYNLSDIYKTYKNTTNWYIFNEITDAGIFNVRG